MPEKPLSVSHRMMRHDWYREEQESQLALPHIAPVTTLVDELRAEGRGWVPYVAPLHGGINARVLSILRDPGPGTRDGSGSGMLCVENDDPAAENLANMMDAASVRANDVLLWNAYPWYINSNPTSAQINAGLDPLYRLLDLLPHLEVVLLQGRVAQVSWERAVNARPEILDRELAVVSTYHPARQALFHPSAEVREMRRRDRIDKMNLVGSLLRSTRS